MRQWGEAWVFRSPRESQPKEIEYYKNRDFDSAIESYRLALEKMDSLSDFLPEFLESKIRQANQAIDQGKSQLASELFNEVLQVDPANIAAAKRW